MIGLKYLKIIAILNQLKVFDFAKNRIINRGKALGHVINTNFYRQIEAGAWKLEKTVAAMAKLLGIEAHR